jgi:hypothetical protein
MSPYARAVQGHQTEPARRQDEHRELDQLAAQVIGVLQPVLRRDDPRATGFRVDHRTIRSIDVRAKQLSLLPYPRCRRLVHPWIRAPRKHVHLDPEFGSDAGERLGWQPSVGGLDQADQVTAVAFEPEKAAQNPLDCGEGRDSRFGRREYLPGMPITTTGCTVTIDRRLQV